MFDSSLRLFAIDVKIQRLLRQRDHCTSKIAAARAQCTRLLKMMISRHYSADMFCPLLRYHYTVWSNLNFNERLVQQYTDEINAAEEDYANLYASM